jgi:hypothetical protein
MAAPQSNAAIEVEVRAKKMSGGENAQQKRSDGTGHGRADGTVVVETRLHCAVSDEASEVDSGVIEDSVRGCIDSSVSHNRVVCLHQQSDNLAAHLSFTQSYY